MKAIFLCISLALMTSAHAQTNIYHSFPVSPIWRVDYNYSYGFGNGCFVTYYYHYYSTGDTTISSYTYKKIHRSFVLDTDTTKCSPVLIDSGYVGALRDDSMANKTYFVFPNTSTDSLLYDYNLSVGDTMKGLVLTGYFGDNIVQSIDSISINGQYRKRWHFPNAFVSLDSVYLIQGIGTSGGLIEILDTYSGYFTYSDLICSKDSSATLFTSYINSPHECNLILNADEINLTNNYSVFPNPFYSQTTFQTDQYLHDATLTINNNFGQAIKQIKNVSGQTITINRDNLVSGIYFLRLRAENKTYIRKLLIIDK